MRGGKIMQPPSYSDISCPWLNSCLMQEKKVGPFLIFILILNVGSIGVSSYKTDDSQLIVRTSNIKYII